jgi:prepilin-type N-terminal cleavage/methylation domain-containing protein
MNKPTRHTRQAGFTLVELMVSMVIGLLIVLALITLLINVTRNNSEMAKTNSKIENGRFAIQLLQSDLAHAGFWGGHVPQFDDLIQVNAPTDVPKDYPVVTPVVTAVPDPCANWAALVANSDPAVLATYKSNLIGISVQAYGATPPESGTGTGCATNFATNKQANTDVLVVRHSETCGFKWDAVTSAWVKDSPNCEADAAGKLYFQASLCEKEISDLVQAATGTTVTLASFASTIDDFYKGHTVRIVLGNGVGQTRVISGYAGTTKVATLSIAWTDIPSLSSEYVLDPGYVLDTSGHVFRKRNCATVADKRKFISNIYYGRNYAVTVGDGIPTLMRSQFDLAAGTLAHQAAQPLIEGIEGFSVEFGIDSISDTGGAVVPTAAIAWADTTTKTSPTNRGDGNPDGTFVRCTDAIPCTAAQLTNVVAVKLHVLARARDASPGYTDTKTYTLGSTTLGPFTGEQAKFKRHVFSTTVRLTNVSGRRETPP